MAALMNLEDCMMCQENMEFILKVTITKMKLLGKQITKGFEGLQLNLTLDSNVMKIENIEAEDENVNIEQELRFQLTPEKFNQKLHISPVMVNLSRYCDNLGTIRIAIADCFADAVMCDEFGVETIEGGYTFAFEGVSNCELELSLQIVRSASESTEFTDFIRRREKLRAKKNAQKKSTTDDLSSSESMSDLTSCDSDVTTDMCPLVESESYERFLSRPSTSKSMKSSVRSSIKCRSDIATSLDVNDFRDDQKTFCHGCGGVSISGVTCDNKQFIPEAFSPPPPKAQSCKLPVHRICSECFEDLTEIPAKYPCPKCERHKELMQAVSFKSQKELKREESQTRGCVRSIFEEILLKDKDRVERDMQRLRGGEEYEKVKVIKKKPKKVEVVAEKKKKKIVKNPRCTKVRNVLKSYSNNITTVKHPGVVRGHKSCMLAPPLVPKNMGWLWNTQNPGISEIRRGWRPGAVPKKVAKMMKFFLNDEKKEPEKPCSPTPNKAALQMQRKNGEYTIVMNAGGDSGDSPITFKISKSEEVKKREEAKKVLKKRGIEKKCQCEKIESCKCISECTKKDFEAALKNISFEYRLQQPLKFSELNESSDSEMDFEFTPPFAMPTPKRCKKPPVSYAATQYEKQEIKEVIVEEPIVKAVLKQGKKKLKSATDAKNLKSAAKPGAKKDMKKGTLGKNNAGNPSAVVQILRDIPPPSSVRNACPTNAANRLTTNYNPLCAPSCPSSIHHPRNCNPSTCY